MTNLKLPNPEELGKENAYYLWELPNNSSILIKELLKNILHAQSCCTVLSRILPNPLDMDFNDVDKDLEKVLQTVISLGE